MANGGGDDVEDVEEGPTISTFKDHFSLLTPSSTIRYRDRQAAARVLERLDDQFILHTRGGVQRTTKGPSSSG